jgi:hypothetical protein
MTTKTTKTTKTMAMKLPREVLVPNKAIRKIVRSQAKIVEDQRTIDSGDQSWMDGQQDTLLDELHGMIALPHATGEVLSIVSIVGQAASPIMPILAVASTVSAVASGSIAAASVPAAERGLSLGFARGSPVEFAVSAGRSSASVGRPPVPVPAEAPCISPGAKQPRRGAGGRRGLACALPGALTFSPTPAENVGEHGSQE